jgi:hypothetical protein
MATLAADTPRIFETGHDEYLNEAPMIDNDIIYDGAAVGDNGSGLARPLAGGDVFIGFATEQADNTGSGHAASAINVKMKTKGVAKLTVVGVSSAADVNELVYASDDATFTLTASGASAIGRVSRWISGTTCLVAFQAKALQDWA